LELERQRHSKQACLETPRVVWPTPGSLFGPRKPIKSVTRGLQTVTPRSGSHGDSLQCICGNTRVPQKRPTARDVETSPSLRRDLLSFGCAFAEPVTALHVVHTWPLGWAIGSIGGDALNFGLPWMLTMGGSLLRPTDHLRKPDKESRWTAERHITICMPRVTLSIGVGGHKMEPGDCRTVGGASKQVCLEWRASKQARLQWPCRRRSKTRVIACHGHEVDQATRICEDGLFWTVTP